jgi:hypothetical protein
MAPVEIPAAEGEVEKDRTQAEKCFLGQLDGHLAKGY